MILKFPITDSPRRALLSREHYQTPAAMRPNLMDGKESVSFKSLVNDAIVLTGPTAAGKSTIAIALAQLIDGEISHSIRLPFIVAWTSDPQTDNRRSTDCSASFDRSD